MSAPDGGGLPGLSVRRPFLAAVMNLMIIIAGVAALLGVEVRELPDIDRPIVSVRANYPGASPTTVDAEVTSLVEGAVARVAGVVAVRSSSEEGNFRMRVEFRPDRDLADASNDVREAVSRIELNRVLCGEDFFEVLGGFDFGLDSGLDFGKALMSPVEPSVANIFQRAAYAWRELPIPVICAIEGVAFGAGMQIALGADIRYASPDAKLSIMESKWGIIPDMGFTATLRHLVSPDRAKELAWSARILDSTQAQALGLITAVIADPVNAARQFAADCATRSPDAVRGIKTLVNEAWHQTEAEALALEARLQSGIIGGKNQIEAVMANLEKRKPDFTD